MGVEQRELLSTMGEIDGVVEIQQNPVGHTGITIAESIDHPQPHAREHAPIHCILQPRERRLRSQSDLRVSTLVAGDLLSRVMAKDVEIVVILVTASDSHHPRLNRGLKGMYHSRRVTGIGDAGRRQRVSPRLRPASRKSSAPPFEDIAPPLNFAWIGRLSTGDGPGRIGLSSDMAGGKLDWLRHGCVCKQIHTRIQLFIPRPPT